MYGSGAQRADVVSGSDPLVHYALRSLADRHQLDQTQAYEYFEQLSHLRGLSLRRICLDYLATANSELH